jgi:hypothetical protein
MKPTKSSMTCKLDKILGEIVRSRGYCVRCGNKDTLQTAHIYSRSNRATRWDLNNVVCFCYNCHMNFAHKNPVMFTEWVKEWLGEPKYTELKIRANSIKKWTLPEMEELYKRFTELKEGQWK